MGTWNVMKPMRRGAKVDVPKQGRYWHSDACNTFIALSIGECMRLKAYVLRQSFNHHQPYSMLTTFKRQRALY